MNEPTREQRKEFWEQCGIQWINKLGFSSWVDSNGDMTLAPEYIPINLNNLFKYAVPIAVSKLESRFDDKTNLIRGLELLFAKWLEKIKEGYSFEDALFWVVGEVIQNERTNKPS